MHENLPAMTDITLTPYRIKVFWLFFSKKNALLSLAFLTDQEQALPASARHGARSIRKGQRAGIDPAPSGRTIIFQSRSETRPLGPNIGKTGASS